MMSNHHYGMLLVFFLRLLWSVTWDTLTWFAALIAMAGYLSKYGLISWFNQSVGKMMVSLHSVNVVFLLGEAILNCLRFPMFRISYFVLRTGIFVTFQWIIHACKNLWWPYPFLDLSSSYPYGEAVVVLQIVPAVFPGHKVAKQIWDAFNESQRAT